MISLEGQSLVLRFPQVHEDASAAIRFQRTLRVPDTETAYALPASLGCFPLCHVDDYTDTIPEAWLDRGGVMLPLYQSEAMWIQFEPNRTSYPFAIKIAAGKVNAITGAPWKPELDAAAQDYIVMPGQPWLDGFRISEDAVRQFVAAPLGRAFTAEEQLTGEARYGGLQIIAYPMKATTYARLRPTLQARTGEHALQHSPSQSGGEAVGLAPGGRILQHVYEDPFGIAAWDQSMCSRCFVTLVDALLWRHITGELPPTAPPSAEHYAAAGLPWFAYYADDLTKLSNPRTSARFRSMAEIPATEFTGTDPADTDIEIGTVQRLAPGQRRAGGCD
jgi:hypothetical protein